MHVQANTVQPGDRVRGIGLLVDFIEPATDFATTLVGKVSTAPNPAAGYDPSGEWQVEEVQVTLPNNHIVNVARYAEPATEEFSAPESTHSFSVEGLAAMPTDQFQAEFDAVTNDEWDGDAEYYEAVIAEAVSRGITA